jgi:hypothetical protein
VTPAGWYRDNIDLTIERYWDGAAWTAQTRPGPEQTMPLPVQAPLTPPAAQPQRPRWYSRAWVVGPAMGLVGIGVGAASAGSSGSAAEAASALSTVTITEHATATVEVTSPPVKVTVTKSPEGSSQVGNDSAAPDGSFVMPNEVGKGLQASQDDLQAISGDPLHYSASRDALADRFQIIDSDWKVCSQNVAPGTRVTSNMTVTFRVVKLDETCP